MALPNIEQWHADHLRLTIFVDKIDSVEPSVLWERLTGSKPEVITSKPQSGEVSAFGPYRDNLTLELKTTLNRLDIIINSKLDPVIGLMAIPSIGTISIIQELLSNLSEILFKEWKSNVLRLAVGTNMNVRIDDSRSGYAVLKEMLPFLGFDLDLVSDFSMQLNASRPSRADVGLMLNRIVKWAVARVEFGSIPFGNLSSTVQHYGRLELDFNTPADHKLPLVLEHLNSIVNELSGDVLSLLKGGGSWLLSKES